MDRNRSVLVALFTGVAIAGSSYAASAVLFGNGDGNQVTTVKSTETATVGTTVKSPSIEHSVKSPSIGNNSTDNSAFSSKPPVSTPNAIVPDTATPKSSEPAQTLTPVYAEQQENLALAKAILRELPGYPCADVDAGREDAVRYFYTFEDLNDDGNDEAIAYLVGPYTCGTGGCTTLIFNVNGDQYTLNSRMTLVQTPIVVSDAKTNGWHDLVVPVSGGGAAPGDHLIQWTGQSYASNPSTAPSWTGTSPSGVALIADTITVDTPAPKLAGEACMP